MITRPLLAATLEDLAQLKFPLLATEKIDGIRVLKLNGKALTRQFKPIPNNHIRALLEAHLPDGIDGELVTPGNFNDIQSQVMSIEGEPEFYFYAFDYIKETIDKPYAERISDMVAVLSTKTFPFKVLPLIPTPINTVDELLEYEKVVLEKGFEGVMLRSSSGVYKCGRSTAKEQILLKLKRFHDAEAVVIGFEEKQTNTNTEEKDNLGLTKRSSKKVGMKPANTLGALIVEDLANKVVFKIGTGFDDTLKKEIWSNRGYFLNKIVTYKYQSLSSKTVPRFPVFVGFRNAADL